MLLTKLGVSKGAPKQMFMHTIQSLYQPIALFVKKRINNKEDAEDLTQEVFLRLSKSDTDKIRNLKSWLYTITQNTITDYYRKRKLQTEELNEKVIPDFENQVEIVKELSPCIKNFINDLPQDDRQLMQWIELDGIPQKEVAEKLNMNYITVRSKTQRARKKLKDLFTQCCDVQQGAKGSLTDFTQKTNSCETNCK